jgi:hypothetical protein
MSLHLFEIVICESGYFENRQNIVVRWKMRVDNSAEHGSWIPLSPLPSACNYDIMTATKISFYEATLFSEIINIEERLLRGLERNAFILFKESFFYGINLS